MSLSTRTHLLIAVAGLCLILGAVALAQFGRLATIYELWQGDRHFVAREYGAAVRRYDTARALSPQDPRPHLRAAAAYLESAAIEKAAAQFHAALDLDPGDADALFGLARVAATQSHPAAAAPFLARASQSRPLDRTIQSDLADALAASGDLTGAQTASTAQLALSSNDPSSSARAHLRLALLLAPEDRAAAAEHSRQAYGGIERLAAAAGSLRDALALPAPRDGAREPYYEALLGYTYLQIGWLAPAQAQLERAVELLPDYGDALSYLGYVDWLRGQNERALEFLRQARAASPLSPLPHYFEGLVHRKARRFGEAVAAFRQAVDLSPDDVALRQELARTLVAAGDYPSAAVTYEQAVGTAPRDAALLLDAARFYLDHLFRIDRGLELAKQSLDLAPEDLSAQQTWARALQLNGDRLAAIAVLENALAKNPTGPELELALGELHAQLGQRDKAAQHYRRALDLDAGPIAEQAAKALGDLR